MFIDLKLSDQSIKSWTNLTIDLSGTICAIVLQVIIYLKINSCYLKLIKINVSKGPKGDKGDTGLNGLPVRVILS